MNAHALSALFVPRSVALIGASADPHSISARPLRMLAQHRFPGPIYPVNPRHKQLLGVRVYPSIADVPQPVDLALVIVPAAVVPTVLEECAAAGVRCAMVITSGFAEAGEAGQQLQGRIKAVVDGSALRVVGPNCEGIYNPSAGLCATFSPAVDPDLGYAPTTDGGPIAVISQSGGLAFALLNQAQDRGLRVGPVISTGNEVDLTWADYADYLLEDDSIRVVLGFVESVRDPARLLQVARKAARLEKPLVLAKIGRTAVGQRAAASHTASLVGSDKLYSAAFEQLGIQRVDDVDEMLDLAAYFSIGRLPAGPRVAVLTASGGAGAWVAEACAVRGLDLSAPDEQIQTAIRAFIPAYGSVANPVDITAQAALSGGYEHALGLLAHSPAFDVVVAVTTLVREERFFETLPDLRQALEGATARVVFYSYTRASARVLSALSDLRIPCYSTPARTAQAVSAAATYASFLSRHQDIAVLRAEVPSAETWPPIERQLSETGARAYLAPLGIPSPPEYLANSPAEAVAAFEALGGGPVALKVQSPSLPHKSDVGGVRLALRSAADIASAYDAILQTVGLAAPGAPIEGVLVQGMAPTGGVEAFVAARRDPSFGPLVVVGLGGLDVEADADVVMRLAPVTLAEAHSALDQLRGAAVLRGTRARPAVDRDALASAVVRVSELAVALPPGVHTVELNPLLVLPGTGGLLMLDAAVELA